MKKYPLQAVSRHGIDCTNTGICDPLTKLLQLRNSMFILITSLILFIAAIALLVLRAARPAFRSAWLIAAGSALAAWLMIFFWQLQMPIAFELPSWQPADLFADAPAFLADRLSWPLALSIATLTLGTLLTAVVRENFPNSMTWAGMLMLGGISLWAVTASNPLTLVLVWAAIDLAELITQLRSVDSPQASERVVVAFSTRIIGISLLLWANVVGVNAGARLEFLYMPPQAGIYLIAAAGLRLGVLPLHLPYGSESAIRRGFGTMLRLSSAISSLVLLARVPAEATNSPATIFLLILSAIAAVYGGWMWLRAPDELSGRPFWMIGTAALAVSAALQSNPLGAIAWGCALILAGGALFLVSVQDRTLSRVLLVGLWGLSALPLSLTASAWINRAAWIWPFLIAAQVMLAAGWVRHALRPGARGNYQSHPIWARGTYSAGIGLFLFTELLLGWYGWDGALILGAWPFGIAASLLTLGLVWAIPRIQTLNPGRAHWVRPFGGSRLDKLYGSLWELYHQFGRLTDAITTMLEGSSGIMWALLFLAIFVSLITQGTP
jgi:hypothetical protein